MPARDGSCRPGFASPVPTKIGDDHHEQFPSGRTCHRATRRPQVHGGRCGRRRRRCSVPAVRCPRVRSLARRQGCCAAAALPRRARRGRRARRVGRRQRAHSGRCDPAGVHHRVSWHRDQHRRPLQHRAHRLDRPAAGARWAGAGRRPVADAARLRGVEGSQRAAAVPAAGSPRGVPPVPGPRRHLHRHCRPLLRPRLQQSPAVRRPGPPRRRRLPGTAVPRQDRDSRSHNGRRPAVRVLPGDAEVRPALPGTVHGTATADRRELTVGRRGNRQRPAHGESGQHRGAGPARQGRPSSTQCRRPTSS